MTRLDEPVLRAGRTPVTTADELSRIGLELIIARGFESVTVDDIAGAAGIGRRTFFRYFASKNDLPWGDFDALLAHMRAHLGEIPDEIPIADALREAVVEFNRFDPEIMPQHRARMAVLLRTPALVAHASLRYSAWRRVIADFAAARLGVAVTSMKAETIAWACLGVSLAAYEHWLVDDSAELTGVIRSGFLELHAVFGDDAGTSLS